MRQAERQTRILKQKLSRQKISENQEKKGYTYEPIAVIESPFPDRRGTPRQPQLVPAAKGKIRFSKDLIQTGHFEELSGFSHIW